MDRVSSFDEPLKKLLGGATAKVMAEHLDLHTVGDLLHHYPRRYEERGKLTALADLPLDEHVTVVAQVADARILTFNNGRGKRLEVTLTDGSGRLQLVFFGHGVHKPHKELLPGRQAMFAGKVSVFNRKMQLAHPTYQLLDASDADEATEAVDAFAGRLLPIYPACKQLDSWRIAKAVDAVLPSARDAVDPLPAALREGRGFTPLPEALLKVHRPQTKADIEDAKARLKWDEAFVLQVALARRRYADTQLPAAARRPVADGLLDAFDAKLPFTLTEGQEKVSKEIFDDLATEHPMHRLLQGEVGSGKTMVALRAMLAVVDAGGQAAMLAPTEVLAQQHHRSITEMMGELADNWGLWREAPLDEGGGRATGGRWAAPTGAPRWSFSPAPWARPPAVRPCSTWSPARPGSSSAPTPSSRTRSSSTTSAWSSWTNSTASVWSSATPSGRRGAAAPPPRHDRHPHPRTVAMTVFGDLETSVLDQLPAGRSPIASHVVPAKDKPHFLARAWERVREEVGNGHQAYVVCPRIGDDAEEAEGKKGKAKKKAAEEDPEKRPPLAVLEIADELRKGALAGLTVEVLHGRMHPDEKDDVMRRFAAGDVDVLVATTSSSRSASTSPTPPPW